MSHPLEVDPVFEASLQRAETIVKRIRNRAAWSALLGLVPCVAVSVLMVNWNESFWGIGWMLIGGVAGSAVHALSVRRSVRRLAAAPEDTVLVHDVLRDWGLLPLWRSWVTSSLRGH